MLFFAQIKLRTHIFIEMSSHEISCLNAVHPHSRLSLISQHELIAFATKVITGEQKVNPRASYARTQNAVGIAVRRNPNSTFIKELTMKSLSNDRSPSLLCACTHRDGPPDRSLKPEL